MDAPRCYFLEIAVELRLEIYKYLLLPTEIVVHPPSGLLYVDIRGRVRVDFFSAKVPRDSKRLYPAILQTCHQVQEEAHSLLYQPSILHLNSSDYDKPIDHTKLHALRSLERLQVDVGNLDPQIYWACEELDISSYKALCRVLPQLHSLQVDHLVVEIPNYRWKDKFAPAVRRAFDWFKAVKGARTTTVHLKSSRCGRASRSIGKEGVWKDHQRRLMEDEDLDSHHNTYPDEPESSRLPSYFAMVEIAHKAVTSCHGVMAFKAQDDTSVV